MTDPDLSGSSATGSPWLRGTSCRSVKVPSSVSYELTSKAGTESTQYDFTMRPWSIDEATDRLTAAGFVAIDIRKGVGRKTDDRFIAVAHTALPVSAPP